MAYKHGVYISEVATSVTAPVQVDAGLPVFVGRAPVNLAANPAAYVNKPLLAFTYAEAVAALGYSDDFDSYELCEAMYVMFKLFGVGPVVLINVLDPAEHKETVTNAAVALSAGQKTLPDLGILLSTLVVKLTEAGQPLVKDTDYTAAFDSDGKVLITRIADGAITTDTTSLVVTYDKLNPAGVVAADIIGGTDATTGAVTGIELIDQVFPKFGLVPGLLASPGWSDQSGVAAVMKSKVQNINSLFKAVAVCDINCTSSGADLYTEAYEWKTTNNYTSEFQIDCWPMVALDGKKFRLSTQLVGLMCYVDSQNGDIPYVSPSNHSLQMDSAITAAGDEVTLGPDQAAYLNGKGIVTAVNIMGGWKAWGNNTGIYPTSSDPKDRWIPVRRMFNWIGNTIITTYWQKVDNPMNKRLIRTVVDSMNIWLNGLTAREALLGGRVEFLESENPVTDLMNGIVRFHVYLGGVVPAEDMEFVLEFDTRYFAALFE
ncbi:phage tail sheath family protein [Anaeroselena agilis]|uniref:Phage tail sheath family protein n=1 Tax=Anaeroselena agilis TaxID=3063788 RepID=A0ABU3NYF7_9FIRM|nr:phage tail sheath family protein [Selenomonadales bacterium 4137-cl]